MTKPLISPAAAENFEDAAKNCKGAFKKHKLIQEINETDLNADKIVSEITSIDELYEKQQLWRETWLKMLGGMPEKTPLEPQITGKIYGDGYTVEKILFQSMPGVYVTGLLYLPDAPEFKPPYPAILQLNGHSEDGKLAPKYCEMSIMAAKEGFGVFTFDPLSQGERVQQPAQYSWKECATEHAALGARSWLLGWNFARFRLHEAVCAIDYMESRKELDLSKLAVTGCSGGGTMSTYIQAFDDRVKVAAPSCYVSSLREVIGERGVHDAEQFFYDQLPEKFNHAVLLAMGQPEVSLLLDCRHSDYFPFAGAVSTAQLIQDLQKKLNIPSQLQMFSSDGSHGWQLCGRNAVLYFLKCIIKNENNLYCTAENGKISLDVDSLRKIQERDFEIPFPASTLTVTASGHVRDLPGFKSLYTVIEQEAEILQKKRKLDRTKLPEIVRRRANIHPLAELPDEPEKFVHDFTWWYLSGAEGVSVELHAAILAVAGRSLIGERAEMFLRNALMEQKNNGGKPVILRAEGVWCIAAAHAYAAEPQIFSAVQFTNPPPSWTDMLKNPDPVNDSFAITVWGALEEYDWTDLVPDKVKISL